MNTKVHFLSFNEESRSILDDFYYSLYLEAFPIAEERESLEFLRKYLVEPQNNRGSEHRIAVLTSDTGELLGGAVYDYLALSSVGLIEFIVIEKRYRGSGLGSKLFSAIRGDLVQLARKHGRDLKGIFAEVNDPNKVVSDQDSIPPFERLKIFRRLGFKRVDLRYLQPALIASGGVVEILILLWYSEYERHKALSKDLVMDTLREYFSFCFGSSPETEAAALKLMSEAISDFSAILLSELTT